MYTNYAHSLHKNYTPKVLPNHVIRLEVQDFIKVPVSYETEPNQY